MVTANIFRADEVKITARQCSLEPQKLAPGTETKNRFFDGYPAIIKEETASPTYKVRIAKDLMVRMRDGTKLAVDIYEPETEGQKFPCLVAWGMWGKDNQDVVFWLKNYPQPYFDSPWWDGTLEVGDIEYFVSRGYVYVIPEPRGEGKSEGQPPRNVMDLHKPEDIYDLIEWAAKQSWCNGKVGMVGPSSYSLSQFIIATKPPPHLAALFPIGSYYPAGNPFTGMVDLMHSGILHGGHIHDSTVPISKWGSPLSYDTLSKEELERRLKELLEYPDIKYHPKIRSALVYPREPFLFDYLISAFHPSPRQANLDKITLPFYVGVPAPGGGGGRIYLAGYEAYNQISSKSKKFMISNPCEFARPFVEMQYETIRWYDHWLKGVDNGIMEEPPIKVFVGGINKWKFENEWPPANVRWSSLYLRSCSKLAGTPDDGSGSTALYQPAPFKDPTVYSLNYVTPPFDEDAEMIGPSAFYLDASIDQDDVNWLVWVVDIDPEGRKQLMTEGWLRASFRALDEEKSKPWAPAHKCQDPVQVPKNERVNYAIKLMPISWVMQEGHSLEVILRTQDDMYSRLAAGGVYFLPRMVDVNITVHTGPHSHLLLPTKEGLCLHAV